MLVEFRVTNFRSIRQEQTLSMVAAKDKTHDATHLLPTGVKSLPSVVRSAVLYGANAAGKSNLVLALMVMKEFVAASAATVVEGQPLNNQPFKLSKKSIGAPTEFEVTFIVDGVRYQYGFAITSERVVEEWLLVYKAPKAQQWFRRKYNRATRRDVYEFSTHLTGKRKLWQESTRANGLFLSTATQLNSDLLRPVFLWITRRLSVIASGMQPNPAVSMAMATDEKAKADMLRFLEAADLGIVDISQEVRKVREPAGFHIGTGKPPAVSFVEVERPFIQFVHKSDNGAVGFDLHEESAGTLKLFAFAGPILNVLREGGVLVVDELDGSLHHLMVRFLVRVFHSEANKSGAQLIFTTHDTALLDKGVFRRDQIWFLEKGEDQSTTLYPMTNFSPRKNEALERGYLEGRYGGLPFLSDLRF